MSNQHDGLVGGFNPSKNISQLGWFFPIHGKNKKCSKPPFSHFRSACKLGVWSVALFARSTYRTRSRRPSPDISVEQEVVEGHLHFSCTAEASSPQANCPPCGAQNAPTVAKHSEQMLVPSMNVACVAPSPRELMTPSRQILTVAWTISPAVWTKSQL